MDFEQVQMKKMESEHQLMESELKLIKKLVAQGRGKEGRLSGNAIALYLHIREFDNISEIFFPDDIKTIADFLQTDKETAEKALNELEEYGWVTFGMFYKKHSKTDGIGFIQASQPMRGDKGLIE